MNKIIVNETAIFSGRERMFIPEGGSHTRQVQIIIPHLFKHQPSVVATVHAFNQDTERFKSSPGTTFAIWAVEYNVINVTQTQIMISAANTDTGIPVDYDFWCEFMVMGKLLHSSEYAD